MNAQIPAPIKESIIGYYGKLGEEIRINSFSFSSGGCINSAGILDTSKGRIFIKWNSREKFPGMFEAEARGLELLKNPGTIKVPAPITTGEVEAYTFILMEYIGSTARSKDFWEQLGQNLADLHRISSDYFGLDHDNYIGSLPQVNAKEKNWIDFYINRRLLYQLEMAVDHGKMGKGHIAKFQKLFNSLPELLPLEEPSLIHGDLWGGNLMTGSEGEPVIIDPAVYYGNREVDLAMTLLFGGYDQRFYNSYNESFQLGSGWKDRVDIYQLYPLLVHVNLFGGGYISQVEYILNRFM